MTISLILLAFLALGLLAMLVLFILLKRDVEARARKDRERVEAMLARLVEAETRTFAAPDPNFAVARTAINLSKRARVMRMLRQGDDPGQIATALGLPRGEVLLLASTETMTAGAMSKAAGAD